jgi:hypothetical protein
MTGPSDPPKGGGHFAAVRRRTLPDRCASCRDLDRAEGEIRRVFGDVEVEES